MRHLSVRHALLVLRGVLNLLCARGDAHVMLLEFSYSRHILSTHSLGSSVPQPMYEMMSRMAHTLQGESGPAGECYRSCSLATAISLLDYFTRGPETKV